MDFFIKDEDQRLAEQATEMDDIDLIMSPIDGALIFVAMKKGRQVCQQCVQQFDNTNPKLRGVEVKMGDARMLLHAQCETGKPRPAVYFNNKIRGMQIRRKLAAAAQSSQSLADISDLNKNKVVA